MPSKDKVKPKKLLGVNIVIDFKLSQISLVLHAFIRIKNVKCVRCVVNIFYIYFF